MSNEACGRTTAGRWSSASKSTSSWRPQTKLFSGSPNRFGDEPNTNIDPVTLGLPGALPVLNRQAVELAMKIGLSLNCTVQPCTFARKNYFYPDMPKAYQISQYEDPLNIDGYLDLPDGTRVGIERAHMEEDAGKSTHVGGGEGRVHGADHSLIDLNRAGVPLVEIVSRPDIRSPEQARPVRDRVAGDPPRDRRVRRQDGGGLDACRRERQRPTPRRRVRHPLRDQERQLGALGRPGDRVRGEAPDPADRGRRDGPPADPPLGRGRRLAPTRSATRKTPTTTATSSNPTSCRSCPTRGVGRRGPCLAPDAARRTPRPPRRGLRSGRSTSEAVVIIVDRGQDDYVLAVAAAGGDIGRAVVHVQQAFAELAGAPPVPAADLAGAHDAGGRRPTHRDAGQDGARRAGRATAVATRRRSPPQRASRRWTRPSSNHRRRRDRRATRRVGEVLCRRGQGDGRPRRPHHEGQPWPGRRQARHPDPEPAQGLSDDTTEFTAIVDGQSIASRRPAKTRRARPRGARGRGRRPTIEPPEPAELPAAPASTADSISAAGRAIDVDDLDRIANVRCIASASSFVVAARDPAAARAGLFGEPAHGVAHHARVTSRRSAGGVIGARCRWSRRHHGATRRTAGRRPEVEQSRRRPDRTHRRPACRPPGRVGPAGRLRCPSGSRSTASASSSRARSAPIVGCRRPERSQGALMISALEPAEADRSRDVGRQASRRPRATAPNISAKATTVASTIAASSGSDDRCDEHAPTRIPASAAIAARSGIGHRDDGTAVPVGRIAGERRAGRARAHDRPSGRSRRNHYHVGCDRMDFSIPAEIQRTLDELDAFIEAEIVPLQHAGRQHAALRPSARVGAHRLRARRRPSRGVGGTAAGDAPAGRRRRLAALALPRSSAGTRRRTSRWRSSVSTWRTRGSGSTTTSRTSRRSSATSRPC